MTLLFYSNLFNVSGATLALLVSLLVIRRFPSPFFRQWTFAYAFVVLTVALELLAGRFGYPRAYFFLQDLVISISSWNFVQTGRILDGKPFSRLTLWGYLAVMQLLLAGATLFHAPNVVVVGLSISGIPVAMGWLATRLLRRRVTTFSRTIPWVGWPMAMLSLWVLTYPVFEGTSLFWVGYWVSGLLNMLVGFGMVVYLLEETAEELRHKNRKLEALDEAKSNFLSLVSHELRTPLASVLGYVELLEDGLQDVITEQQRDFFLHTRRSASQLGALIDTLLDSAQLEAGELAIALEPIDVNAFLTHHTESLRPLLGLKRLSLELHVPSDLPPASADQMRLTQVMNNLLGNAIKFTPADGRLHVSVSRVGDLLEIRVSDSGIGIEHERLEDVFQPFVQLEESMTRQYGGTGLGLAITRRLVELMGGTISLESQLGRGTTACFTVAVSPASVPFSQAIS